MSFLDSNLTVKGIARVLRESLINGGTYDFVPESEREKIIQSLKGNPKKTMRSVFRSSGLRFNTPEGKRDFVKIIEAESPDCFATCLSFNIFGCELSTDRDIAFNVSSLTKPLLTSEKERIVRELKELGHNTDDESLEFDPSFVSFNEKGFWEFSKGGKEIINMVIYTYDLREQAYPPIFTEDTEIDLSSKCFAIEKYILDNSKFFMTSETYMSIYDIRKVIYQSGKNKRRFDFSAMCYALFNTDPTSPEWTPKVWKSLLVKYIQLLILDCGMYNESTEFKRQYFRKLGLIDLLTIYCERNEIEKSLAGVEKIMRKIPPGADDDLSIIDFLHNKFVEISERDMPTPEWYRQQLFPWVPGMGSVGKVPITDELFMLYLENPQSVTEEFAQTWIQTYGGTKINPRFVEDLDNVECLNMHPEVKDHILKNKEGQFASQKSPEWLEALDFYTCGNNTGINPLDPNLSPIREIQARSNLFMGSLGECMVYNEYNFEKILPGFEKCTIGMLVDKLDVKGSQGSSPDALLVNHEEIVPVEIKTIGHSPGENSHFLRGFSLAKRQLNGTIDQLNKIKEGVSQRGLLVILWVFKDPEPDPEDEEDYWYYMCTGCLLDR